MEPKKRGCSPYILFFLFLLACLAALPFALIALNLPARAEALYGPPAAHLDPARRLVYSTLLLIQKNTLISPADPLGEERSFEIAVGESAPSVINRLWKENLIVDAGAFRTYLTYGGLDTTLQAGRYKLSPAMTPLEIAAALQDATPKEATITILSGWRLDEIAASLPTTGVEINSDIFLQVAHSRPQGYSFTQELPDPPSLEGFLFPGKYVVPRDITADALLRLLLDAFEAQVTEDLRQGFAHRGLTLHEAVTLASIVEKEAVVDEEKPLIASVFYNRLALPMKLDSDPTVQYALGFDPKLGTWWKNPLSLADLQVDSAYNTYRVPGLPPGPIASPSLSALQAVAFPAQTPYYYFRAGCAQDGRHLFAETFQEHLQNECPQE